MNINKKSLLLTLDILLIINNIHQVRILIIVRPLILTSNNCNVLLD